MSAARVPIAVGHKGADALVRGNTIASFEAAAELGVEIIELDVLWTREGSPKLPAHERSPLVVAHDWEAAGSTSPPTLDEVLEAFTRAPLDRVRFDLDLKLTGREADVAAALQRHGLIERAMFSTMEASSVRELRRIAPALSRGFTIPKVTRPWDRRRWARPAVLAALAAMRLRMPRTVKRRVDELELDRIWVFHPLITEEVVEAAERSGAELIAWTVDDPKRIAELTALGVHGICSNDPRLLLGARRQRRPALGGSTSPADA